MFHEPSLRRRMIKFYEDLEFHVDQWINPAYLPQRGFVQPGFLRDIEEMGIALEFAQIAGLIQMPWIDFFYGEYLPKWRHLEEACLGAGSTGRTPRAS